MKGLKTSSRDLDDDFEKIDEGPQSNWYRLPSDFNVEVEGVDVEVVRVLRNEI
jgi:hypothetical protein